MFISLSGVATGESDLQERIEVPSRFGIVDLYPNPFNDTASVMTVLPYDGYLSLQLLDVLGRSIGFLHRGEMPAGLYSLDLTATGLSSGIYIIRAEFGDGKQDWARTVHLKRVTIPPEKRTIVKKWDNSAACRPIL